MDRKRIVTIAVIVLLIIITSVVLVAKFSTLGKTNSAGGFLEKISNFFSPDNQEKSKKTELPVEGQTAEGQESEIKERYEIIDPSDLSYDGTVLEVENNILTLATNIGEKIVEITSDHTIFLVNGENQEEAKVTDLKKDSEVRIRYNGPEKPPKINTSNANQGVVTAIGDKNITVKMDSGEKIIDTTVNPTIYLVEDGQSVIKKISDLKIGTVVTVAYADAVTKALAVAIRIDNL